MVVSLLVLILCSLKFSVYGMRFRAEYIAKAYHCSGFYLQFLANQLSLPCKANYSTVGSSPLARRVPTNKSKWDQLELLHSLVLRVIRMMVWSYARHPTEKKKQSASRHIV